MHLQDAEEQDISELHNLRDAPLLLSFRNRLNTWLIELTL